MSLYILRLEILELFNQMMLVTNIGLGGNFILWSFGLNEDNVPSSAEQLRRKLPRPLWIVIVSLPDQRQLLRWSVILKMARKVKVLSQFFRVPSLQTPRSVLSLDSLLRATRFRHMSSEEIRREYFAYLALAQTLVRQLTCFESALISGKAPADFRLKVRLKLHIRS